MSGDILIVQRKTFEMLPKINKAIILLLQEDGEAKIIENDEAAPVAGGRYP